MMRRICAALIFVLRPRHGVSRLCLSFILLPHPGTRFATPTSVLPRWNPVLRGSHDSLLRQNEEIDRLKLTRISDDQQLEELEMRGELVNLHESRAMQIASNLELNRRFCRPWTRDFLEDLSQALLRPVSSAHPGHLRWSARSTSRPACSARTTTPPPSTATPPPPIWPASRVDIGKRPMSRRERAWIDQYVLQSAATRTGGSRRGAPPGLLPHHGQQSLRRVPRISRGFQRRNVSPQLEHVPGNALPQGRGVFAVQCGWRWLGASV